jgi:quercetin dioxygenase-like cupin family protein
MNIRVQLLIGAVAITCGIVGIALATPIVGLNFNNILAFGTINTEVLDRARVVLPAVVGKEQEDEDNDWTAKLITSGPSNFIVLDGDYFPGGHTGWHSHPGILLLTVTEGSIEWYNSNCEKTVYKVGDSLTENTQVHYFRNVGSVNARVMATFIIAKGQPRRIDQPAPACAMALGLD